MLLSFAIEKGCRSLQVFWDSMVVINWIIEEQRCHNVMLLPILEEPMDLKFYFDNIYFHHVFKERNGLVDQYFKEAAEHSQGGGRS